MNEPRLSSTCLAGDAGDLEVEHRRVLSFVVIGPARGEPPAARGPPRGFGGAESSVLLRVQLDDELLLHRRRDLTTLGLAQHLRGERRRGRPAARPAPGRSARWRRG